jgi:hypothetical protein
MSAAVSIKGFSLSALVAAVRGDTHTNYQLLPGDRIVVGSRTLCEELAFWKQSTECDRCCRAQCKERDPQSVPSHD